MARLGLGADWQCLFANDICPKKAAAYIENFGEDHFRLGDVAEIKAADLPGRADLLWASSPCQDFSLAGNREGAEGQRSGNISHVLRLASALLNENRAPKVIVIENVTGLITSNGGRDLVAIIKALNTLGYSVCVETLRAEDFVPQSRDRIFILASLDGALEISQPEPDNCRKSLSDILESDVEWHEQSQTERILAEMSDINRDKIFSAPIGSVGAYYRRTRKGSPVYEIRFDGLAGCLRTASGGSSVQNILVKSRDGIKTRRMTAREAARLMGLPESYILPASFTDAYTLCGDGVVVPVVRHLAGSLTERLASQLCSVG